MAAVPPPPQLAAVVPRPCRMFTRAALSLYTDTTTYCMEVIVCCRNFLTVSLVDYQRPPLLLTIFTVLKEDGTLAAGSPVELATVHANSLLAVKSWLQLGPQVCGPHTGHFCVDMKGNRSKWSCSAQRQGAHFSDPVLSHTQPKLTYVYVVLLFAAAL